jgi:hypothetical protein
VHVNDCIIHALLFRYRSIYFQWAIAAGTVIFGFVIFTIALGETMRVLTGMVLIMINGYMS